MSAEVYECEWVVDGHLRKLTVRVRSQSINLLVGSEEPSYHFDRAGRLIGGFVAGRSYQRSLDNRVLQKWPGPGGSRQRRWLEADEARRFVESAYALAGGVAEQARAEALSVLQRWDWSSLQADAVRFARIYRPVGILPPDQYLALVLQATEGCSHNRCTFCDFYRDRPFRIKTVAEFRSHIGAVREFFGPAIGLRKSLFLADANALLAPMPLLRGWLAAMAAEQILPQAGIYSFVDAFHGRRKTAADWAELKAGGLRRVYIGMESGDDDLLRALCKRGSAADVMETVRALKAARLAVSLILMTGAGGDRFAASHVERTIAVLNAMPLSSDDLIYFSPLRDHAGSEYGRWAAGAGIRPLSDAEVTGQEAAIRAGLMAGRGQGRPRVSRYNIEEFIY